MKRKLLGFAVAVLLSAPVLAQSPVPGQMNGKGGGQMPMAGQMQGMSGDQPQQMREMMGMMRQMMPMMKQMQKKGMTPDQRAEMMKQMAPMMQAMMPMMQKMMPGAPGMMDTSSATSGSSAAYAAAMMKMQADMPMPYTGDADVDYARGMIPHHEGAIAMSNVVLQYGKNPEMKKFAEGVIKAQTAEIATLREWLAKNGK